MEPLKAAAFLTCLLTSGSETPWFNKRLASLKAFNIWVFPGVMPTITTRACSLNVEGGCAGVLMQIA